MDLFFVLQRTEEPFKMLSYMNRFNFLRISVFLFVLSFLALSAQGQKRPMTTDDGLKLVNLGAADLHPQGSFAWFEKSELDWEANKRKSSYWYIAANGSDSYPYLGEGGGSDIRFSPRGTYLSFKRKADGKQQLFLMPTAGGEAFQLSEHHTNIGTYVWTADESTIYFLADHKEDEEVAAEKKKGNDAYFVDEGPNGQTEDAWNDIWKLELSSKTITRITTGEHLLRNLSISTDGSRLAFSRRTENRRNQGNLSEIFVYHIASGKMEQLTDNEAPEGDLEWSPDGKWIAFTAPDDKTYELKNDKIWLLNPETKAIKQVSGAFEGNIGKYIWAPDSRSILFAGLQRTQGNLYRLQLDNLKVSQLTNGEGQLRLYATDAAHSKALVAVSTLQKPADLSLVDLKTGAFQALTNLNPQVEENFAVGETEIVRWKSKDGLEIEGILIYPVGYEKGNKYPLLLHIHGGPAGVFTNAFRTSYQVWAGLGYIQLLPNVRGSSGYSDELLRGNMQDIGGMDYEDLMSGVDALIEKKLADPDKMAVRGWSYGGILGGTTLTKTNRFKAASLGAMVSDWTSEYGIGFNHDVRLWYIGGTPWENPEAYRDKSPLTHASNISTPLLLMHGMGDDTDTEAQSMMFFNALKDMGKDVRYLRFPREPHGFREPRHQRARDLEEIRWVQKHTLGIDWVPPLPAFGKNVKP